VTAAPAADAVRPTAGPSLPERSRRSVFAHRLGRLWPLGLAAACQVLLLAAPLLPTGYAGDDQANSLFHWGTKFDGIDFWEQVRRVLDFWIFTEGRLYPVSFIQGYGTFEVVHSLVLYKVILLVWVLASSFAVGMVLVRMGLGAKAAGLVVVGASALFQFRLYNDPIYSFAGLMPSVLLEITLSLWLFQGWLRVGGRARIVGSVALFVLAALTYESAYVFAAFHVIVALFERRRWQDALRASVPLLVPTALFLGTGVALRARAPAGAASVYAPNLDPGVVAKAAVEQLSAALPLSYPLWNLDQVFEPRSELLFRHIGVVPILVGFGIATTAWLFMRGSQPLGGGGRRMTAQLALLGTAMWVLAALPVSLAPRYQTELNLGLGHVPVYVEYFGVALLGLAVIRAVFGWLMEMRPGLRGIVTVALALCLGIGAALTYRANELVSAQLRQPAERTALAAGLKAGILRDAPNGSNIAPIPVGAWQQGAFYLRYTGRRYVVYDPAGRRTRPTRHGCVPTRPGPWFTRSGASDIGNFAIASCQASAGRAPTTLFLQGSKPRRVLIAALAMRGISREPRTVWVMPTNTDLLPSGDRFVQLYPPWGLDLFSLQLAPFSDTAGLAIVEGCSIAGIDGKPGYPCARHTTLMIRNLEDHPQRLDFKLSLATAGPHRSKVKINGPCGIETKLVGITPTPVHCRLALQAHGNAPVHLDSDGPRLPALKRPSYLRIIDSQVAPS
jgi:hypothetical protein